MGANEPFQWRIEIYNNGPDRPTQILTADAFSNYDEKMVSKKQLLVIGDVNFDGRDDIRLARIGLNDCCTYTYWVYSVSTDSYVLVDQDIYEQLKNPKFNAAKREVTCYSNESPKYQVKRGYKWWANTLVADYKIEYLGAEHSTVCSKMINGEYVVVWTKHGGITTYLKRKKDTTK